MKSPWCHPYQNLSTQDQVALVRNRCRMKRQKHGQPMFSQQHSWTVFLRVTSFSTQLHTCEIALPPPKTNMEAENRPSEYSKQSSKPSFFRVPTVSFQGSADENLITFDITSPPTFGIVDKQTVVLLKTTEIWQLDSQNDAMFEAWDTSYKASFWIPMQKFQVVNPIEFKYFCSSLLFSESISQSVQDNGLPTTPACTVPAGFRG